MWEQMKNRIKILSLVGIALFIIILSRINLGALFSILYHTNIMFLLLAIGVNGAAIILKSLKWKIIVNSIKPEFSLKESVMAFLVGFSFSTITPAKLGDFIKVLYINDETCSMGKSLSTIVIDRLIDILLLFFVAFVGIYGFSVLYHIEVISTAGIIVIIFCLFLGMYILLNKPILSALLKPFFNIVVPQRLKSKVSIYYDDFFVGLNVFYQNRKSFFSSIFIGILYWIPTLIYGYLLALSLGIDVGLFFFILVLPILGMLDFLPISISGIGTRDLALIYLFGLKGVSAEQAIAFSLLYLFMSYWLIALLGVGVFFKYPIEIPEETV